MKTICKKTRTLFLAIVRIERTVLVARRGFRAAARKGAMRRADLANIVPIVVHNQQKMCEIYEERKESTMQFSKLDLDGSITSKLLANASEVIRSFLSLGVSIECRLDPRMIT